MTLTDRIAELRRNPALADLRRSFDTYYGDPTRDIAMDRLYACFVVAGDLVFDIGSHVGDRIGAFRRLGARVIALEPQPVCAGAIRTLYAGDRDVTPIELACGARPGTLTLHVNSRNRTVSTASTRFLQAARRAEGWEGQDWDDTIEVPVTTLGHLFERHGQPAFVKIDVEGLEAEVLAGLTAPVPALSFEFTTIQRDVATACLDRLTGIADYRFNFALGESQELELAQWVAADELRRVLETLPHAANSGDVYAVLRP